MLGSSEAINPAQDGRLHADSQSQRDVSLFAAAPWRLAYGRTRLCSRIHFAISMIGAIWDAGVGSFPI